MPAYVAVLKGDAVVEAYSLVDAEDPPPKSENTTPVQVEDEFIWLATRLAKKYPRPEYEIVAGGFASLEHLVQQRHVRHHDYDHFFDEKKRS